MNGMSYRHTVHDSKMIKQKGKKVLEGEEKPTGEKEELFDII